MKKINLILFIFAIQMTTSLFAQVDTSKYAIIPFSESMNWMFKESKAAALTKEDIDTIEPLLKKCIADYNLKEKKKLDTGKYYRQYIAVTNKNGEKEVWVNCFCNAYKMNWKHQVVEVDDGGDCFFRVKINLTAKKYYDFGVNGVG